MNSNDWKLKPPTVNPTPLNFGTLTPDSIIPIPVLISNPNDKPIIWRADKYGTTWLILDETTTTGTLQPGGQQEINVTVNTNSIPMGIYAATLTFTADTDDESASVQIPVYMAISAAPDLLLKSVQSFPDSPFKVSLSLVQYLNSSESLPLAIENKDSQNPVNWTADTGGANWLSVDRSTGTLQPGERQTLYITANTNSLTFKEYPATLSFTTDNTPAPIQLNALLHVGALPDGDNGPHAPIVKPDNLDFDNPQQGQHASFQVTSDPQQGAPVNLTISNNGMPWLNVQNQNTPLQPGEQTTVTVTIDPTTVTAAGTYKTDLLPTFTFNPTKAGSHSTSIPVHVEMTVP
jgi:Viral BACON domain